MAHSHEYSIHDDKLELGPGAKTAMIAAFAVGLLGLLAAAGVSQASEGGLRRFFFAYLTAYAYFLSLALGGLFFVLLQYCVRAGWSVNVRRVPEALARTLPLMLFLSLPMIYTIAARDDGILYRWAQPVVAHGDHAKGEHDSQHGAASASAGHTAPETVGEHAPATKEVDSHQTAHGAGGEPSPYVIPDPGPLTAEGKPIPPDDHLVGPKKEHFLLLAKPGVITRILGFLTILSVIAYWYTNTSRRQDKTEDPSLTHTLDVRAAPMLVIFGVALTSLSFDLLMSLDPKWFSTMYGPYYFAGSVVSMFAAMIIGLSFLQKQGYLQDSVTVDHYHDISKFQFAFTFFWGYLGFSQYMLLWYSAQPEEIEWLARRGASTAHTHLETFGGWTKVSLVLLFVHLLIPFPGLLSRHVKRVAFGRNFWAIWILAAHYLDMYWLVMPEYNGKVVFGLPEIAAFLGVAGLFLTVVIWSLASAALRPIRDPRAHESLAFHQTF